jgi:hypothetical protein
VAYRLAWFVATLPTMQLVDGALKGLQCRDLLKAAGYDFNKLDDYLTREQMQERIRMRPVQRRLQQSGIVATYRGAQLWGSWRHRGGLPPERGRPVEQGGGCGQLWPAAGPAYRLPDCVHVYGMVLV